MATDIDIDYFLTRFQTAKGLFQLTEMPDSQRAIFEELGLLADPDFHIQLELIHAEGMRQRREQEHIKTKRTEWRQM